MNKIKLKLLTILGIILAICYLVYYASFKYYWHDEIIVLLHISGYSQEELVEYLYDGEPKSQQDLQKFQMVNDDKSWDDTMKSIYQLTPHKPPLYVILLSIWAKIFGSKELALRSLSIVIYLIFIFCVYHLALILFGNQKISLIATIFTGLSPRFMDYALDVWKYGLFALVTILSSFLLLKAFAANKSLKWWLGYGISLVAGLYTHIFFILVALAHLTYVIVNRSLSYGANKTYFFTVWIFSLCLYLPWIQIMINHNAVIYAWAKGRWSLAGFVNTWLNYIPSLFSGAGKDFAYGFGAIFLFSLYYLVKKTPQKTWSFIILLMGVPFLSLVTYDLLFGTRYSAVGRFYLPTLIAILFSISFLIGQGLNEKNKLIRIASYIVLFLLISLNLYSKIPDSQAETKFRGYGSTIPNAAFIVNQAEKPLVIGEDWQDMFPLSHKAKETTNYLLVDNLDNVKIDRNYSDIFVLDPSSSFQQKLMKAGLKLEETNNQALWKIKDKFN
jgi:uncharacterized membrane protein